MLFVSKCQVLFNNIKKQLKEGNSKSIVVNYSPEFFIVSKVIHSRKSLLERNKYILENADGDYLKNLNTFMLLIYYLLM